MIMARRQWLEDDVGVVREVCKEEQKMISRAVVYSNYLFIFISKRTIFHQFASPTVKLVAKCREL